MWNALADLREAVVFSHFGVRQPVKAAAVFDEQPTLHHALKINPRDAIALQVARTQDARTSDDPLDGGDRCLEDTVCGVPVCLLF